MSEPLGIIGLGRTGLATAKVYLKDGYEIFGCDTNPAALREFASAGGRSLQNPAEVARHAAVVLVMVLNDEQVTEVFTGENGLLKSTGPGSTVICMSTVNHSTIEFVAMQCNKKNTGFVDCPFTGGPQRIASRSLTLIAAAHDVLIARVRNILEVIGKIVHAGNQPGQGQAVKHCNQLLVGATHAATMEVITMARRLGLDPTLVAAVAGSGIAGSDYFRLLSESVLRKTPSPGGLGQMCKDMAIVKNTLNEIGMEAYVASAAAEYFSAARNLGNVRARGRRPD